MFLQLYYKKLYLLSSGVFGYMRTLGYTEPRFTSFKIKGFIFSVCVVNSKFSISESIKEIYWDEKATADQYLNIVTKKRTMRIGANDCGIWEDRTRY